MQNEFTQNRERVFHTVKMIFRGYRFGLLLQIAIGPVFIFVLKTAVESGIFAAEAAVAAATIVDTLYVTLAMLGVGKLLEKPVLKGLLKYLGTLVLVYFGAGITLGGFNIHIIPGLGDHTASAGITGSFLLCFLLTASSPLTILFWTGLFATKLTKEGHSKTDVKYFGAGAVLTTLTFLGVAALFAGLLEPLMTESLVDGLNVIAGIILTGFAVKMFFGRKQPATKSE